MTRTLKNHSPDSSTETIHAIQTAECPHQVVCVCSGDTGEIVSPGSEKTPTGEISNESWAAYKLKKGRGLSARGYRVYATSTSDHWMRVVIPQGRIYCPRRVWADVKFFSEPSEYGIDGGRISKLTIETIMEIGVGGFRPGKTLFCFERGPMVNRLKWNRKANQLYGDLLRELN